MEFKNKTLNVSIDEYWEIEPRNRPRTFEGLMKVVTRKGGYWKMYQRNSDTGHVTEQWISNALTDNGCIAAFSGLAGAAITTITPANRIAIDASLGYTTLTTQIASGTTPTSITVGALTGPTIPIGVKLLVGAGGPTTITFTLTQAITGAGTYTGTASGAAAANIIVGSNVRYDYTAVPGNDAAALTAASYTAALPAGQFTLSPTTGNTSSVGIGSRQITIATGATYQFSTTGSPAATAGAYTAGWLVNANPVAAVGNTFAHVVFDSPINISSSQPGQVTIIEKL